MINQVWMYTIKVHLSYIWILEKHLPLLLLPTTTILLLTLILLLLLQLLKIRVVCWLITNVLMEHGIVDEKWLTQYACNLSVPCLEYSRVSLLLRGFFEVDECGRIGGLNTSAQSLEGHNTQIRKSLFQTKIATTVCNDEAMILCRILEFQHMVLGCWGWNSPSQIIKKLSIILFCF